MAKRALGFVAALTVAGAFAAAAYLSPSWVSVLRERGFDLLMPSPAALTTPAVHVVEIARQGAEGAWGRSDLAALITALAASQPSVIGVDILVTGNCTSDGAKALAGALIRVQTPLVLAFLLTDEASAAPGPQPPMAVMPKAPAWDAPGAEAPCAAFAAGHVVAMAAIQGDRDGRVRALPVAAFVGGRPFAAFALELARLGMALPPSTIGRNREGNGWLRFGDVTYPVAEDGQIRIAPTDPAARKARTHSASDILAGRDRPPAGAVVLIGSALPESGDLRPSRISPLHPGLHLQADGVEQIMAGTLPLRPLYAPMLEAGLALAGALMVCGLVMLLPPLGAAFAAGGLVLALVLGARLAAQSGLLLDPILPGLAVAGSASVALLAEAITQRAQARRLNQRMRKHLPASVVSRLDASGGKLIPGESREITSLITDIEGFSAMTRRIPTADLVAVLDAYMTVTTNIVAKHGGMVDKIVGDAVHAFFNAPDNLEFHVDHAIACAAEILRETEALRRQPIAVAAGLGRTRVGLEAGMALLGDVGHGGRVDYTAHGDAVNMSARLQDANKDLGTSILIGPRAAELARTKLREGPEIDLRSFGTIRVSFLDEAP
jgi:adenylate cyclase